MKSWTVNSLLARSLRYYWRNHAATAAGAAAAVAVLGGALLVGASVRASLREIATSRLGGATHVLAAPHFFRERLAGEMQGAPLIAFDGMVVHDENGRRASKVAIYGVDERFWAFHGHTPLETGARNAYVTPALANDLAAKPEDSLQIRIEKPSAIPAESLHGRKDDPGRTIRVTVKSTDAWGFLLRPQQGDVRAMFVPLLRLQRDLEQDDRVNVVLLKAAPPSIPWTLEDAGLRIRGTAVESEATLLGDRVVEVIRKVAPDASPVYTYLANTVRANGREIPYSVVTAMDIGLGREEIALNEWAARDLGARPGDAVTLEYHLWEEGGRLLTRSAEFRLARVLPMKGIGADRTLTPEYPGISDADSFSDWDPPFPIELKRIRKVDEAYWDEYRTAPKAFVQLARGQELWGTRFGKVTSVRADGLDPQRLRAALDPAELGLVVQPVREEALTASQGATDFGEYFTYFSFFLVVSALLLAGLFFRFGVEQRSREIGTLRALGFSHSRVRRLFVMEGLLVAAAGSIVGAVGAIVYAWFIVAGLRTFWRGAVGTSLIRVEVTPLPVVIGAIAGLLAALLFTMALRRSKPRELMAGGHVRRRWPLWAGVAAVVIAVGLLGAFRNAGGFFGAGALLLCAALCFLWVWLTARRRSGVRSVPQLGMRWAAHRPGRAVLAVALIASAAFIIVSVDAFRKRTQETSFLGHGVIAESVLPVYHDLGAEYRFKGRYAPFRVKAGDDASCLNLYQPRDPRVIAPPSGFATSEPWHILDAAPQNGAVPALVDANTLTYVLHRKLGDILELPGGARLRLAGVLHDSPFQSELIVSAENFVRLFPHEGGYKLFLLEAPPEEVARLEERLSDFGFDASPVAERLAAYHRVENTYISTFQTLGALGLLLGTFGLAAVLLRNVIERRREMALLRAVGYTPARLRRMLFAENAVVLVAGLAIGAVCAAVAVAPVWFARGGGLPWVALLLLGLVVPAAGLIASLWAARLAVRRPLLAGLRAE
jgi:ABC-type lipoprotein release transport system permease subunit